MSDYSKIMDHPHHRSDKHPHMSMRERAAQFSSFAALSGYDEAVKDTANDVLSTPEIEKIFIEDC
ncbi:MAG: hypothetical protein K6A38_00415 [Lachnospiraceae bacterium]|nr:hypothetical protein [Lachnospiraceae bacterium]